MLVIYFLSTCQPKLSIRVNACSMGSFLQIDREREGEREAKGASERKGEKKEKDGERGGE